MSDFYILDAQNNPIEEPDHKKWSKWYCENITTRSVGDDTFTTQDGRAIRVSTVFLSIPHPMIDSDDFDALYETMVFTDEDILSKLMDLAEQETRGIMGILLGIIEMQKRYRTKEQAIAGHKTMCEFVQFCVKVM